MTGKNERSASESALSTYDETFDLFREKGTELLTSYLPWSIPFIMACLLFLFAVNERQRSAFPWIGALLVLTGFVRWMGGFAIQRRAALCLGAPNLPTWRTSILPFLWLRLFYFPVLAGPLAFDPAASKTPLAHAWNIKRSNESFFFSQCFWFVTFIAMSILQIVAVQLFVTEVFLPFMLGVDDRKFAAVLFSRLWLLGLGVVFFLCWEAFILVFGVVAHRNLSLRRTGDDLHLRMRRVRGDGK